MRDRINCLIDYANDQPYALRIRYHLKYRLKYVCSYQKLREDDKLPRMQKITFREAQTMFFDSIRLIIFEEHVIRSLQSLLQEYSSILSQYGFSTSSIKSSYIKDILIREFGDEIGFWKPCQDKIELYSWSRLYSDLISCSSKRINLMLS